jgi:Beta-lactamase enzyme family
VIQGPLFLASVSLLMSTQVSTPPDRPAAAAAERQAEWRGAFGAGERWAGTRRGRVSFALVDDQGKLHSHDGDEPYRSASVVKAMLLVAYLNREEVRNEPLDAESRALLVPMIETSDNNAASRVHDIVGNPGLAQVARWAGMTSFASAPGWGNAQITAEDQARFFARVDGLVPDVHRRFARSLLSSVVPGQRWGVPAALPSWVRVYFKGGWRPEEGGWIVHQAALGERAGRRVALAVLTDRDSSEAYGHQTIEGVARRVLRPLARP